jgi:hypothetical protein
LQKGRKDRREGRRGEGEKEGEREGRRGKGKKEGRKEERKKDSITSK